MTASPRRVRTWAAVTAVAALGCAEPDRTPDPLRYLQLGVDPETEARAVARDLQRAGFRIERRVAGRTFVAIGVRDPLDDRTAVRIVTRRGIALGLDAPDPRRPSIEAVSLAPAPRGRHDIDGDGCEEVLVRVRDARRGRRCIGIVRVRADGRAVEDVLRLRGIEASPHDLCIRDVRNIGGGPSLEALVPVGHDAVARDRVPTVVVPFVGREHYWVPAPAEAYRGYWKRQRSRRRRELGRARGTRDVDTAYRLAIELAAIARRAGKPEAAQVRAFDDALKGLVLTPAQARAVDAARRMIQSGWDGQGSEEAHDS